ncbi:MAG: outer membrane beta-barrel protein [Bdellovibrionales bacterium]|jgi:hypothetical protein|nr:outer membrane beta-barrel protein [Bdellovibrionales bacterium]
MKNLMRALVILMVFGGIQAQAQTVQKRLVQIDESTGELIEVTQAQPHIEEAPSIQAAPAQGIVILNNQKAVQTSSQTAIQDQPANVIEDSPLSTSQAERIRRQRQALEVQTEQRIVEKLEAARIEDERARSERLFGNGFGSQQPVQQAPQQVQVIQAPVPVVEVVQKAEEPKVDVKEEVRAALEEMRPKKDDSKTSFYIQGLVGIGEYPDAVNVRGNLATGFAVGVVTPERLVAEGSFQYSEYDIETMQNGYSYAAPPFKTMTQYNFSAALKYQILGGRVRPLVGVLAGYTYRSYAEQQYYYGGGTNSVSSNAFDIGGLVGLDIQLTDAFALGVDFRYMKNIAHRENNDYQQSFMMPRVGTPVEEIGYYFGLLSGKFTF